MDKKQYTLEEFEWVWKDSSVYDILNQFYYEHIELQKLLQQTDQLTNNWNKLEKDINNQLMMTRKFDDYNEGFFDATLHYYNKMKEIKEGNKCD